MALPSAAASGGEGLVFLPFVTVPTHKITNSPHWRRRSQAENGLSVGALAEPQGMSFLLGYGVACAVWTGVLLASSSPPLWFRARSGPALPSPVSWPVFLSPWSCAMLSVCLSDSLCGCWPPH